MHKMVKSKTPYKIEYFDFLNDDLRQYTDYFVNLKDNPFTNSLHLSYLSLKPWSTLKNILSEDEIKSIIYSSSYECPFNGYKHTSLVPVAILTDNPIDYIRLYNQINPVEDRDLWYSEMACDPTWNKDDHINYVDQYINSINKALLGPGYTESFYPNDGHNSIDTVAIQLENGDYILFLILKWYNK